MKRPVKRAPVTPSITPKKKKKSLTWRVWLTPVVVVLVLLAGVIFAIRVFLSADSPSKKQSFTTITLIKPPPPPEVKEKPPEQQTQPKETPKQTIEANTPPTPNQAQNDTPDDAPPGGDQLGVEGAGGAGNDGFGLRGGVKGGRSITVGGGGGGMGRLSLLAKYGWYTSKLQEEIKRQFKKRMEKEGGVPKGRYEITLKVLLDQQGVVKKYRIVASSGNEKMDEALKGVLPGLRVSQVPPEGMPPTVTLRITSQG